jgi:hypothetical protein
VVGCVGNPVPSPYGRPIAPLRSPRRRRALAALGLVLALTALVAPAAPAAAQEGPPPRPDAQIRLPRQGAYGGNGVYNLTGNGQSRSAEVAARGTAWFYVLVQNDSQGADDLRVLGSPSSSAFAVRYHRGSTNITRAVLAGTYVVPEVRPGAGVVIGVEVQALRGASPGSRRAVAVTAQSNGHRTYRDKVVATVSVPLYSAEQRRVAELVNNTRRSNGRGSLVMNRQLATKAQSWARHMASQGRLSHSNLSSGAPSCWRALAENVGTGTSIAGIHRAFLNSGGHRANILGSYSQIGTGYATGHGRLWVVHVFMRC